MAKLCPAGKAAAKKKFDVYPSAYANGWAAKKYKAAGGSWKTATSESVELEEKKGCMHNHKGEECPVHGAKECPALEKVDEAVRIPAKTGNIISSVFRFRSSTIMLKIFFPQTSVPKKSDVQDQIEKIYPGARLLTYMVSDYEPGQPILHAEGAAWTKSAGKNKEGDLIDPPDDLSDGDAMTEQSLSEIEDEIGSIDEEELLNEIDDVGDNSLTGIDPDVEIPDTVPEDLVNEVDKADFDEFKNLVEPSDAVVESVEDIAESIVDNASSQLTPDEVDSFANIAEQYKMQGDKLINNIPDQVVKKRIKNKMTELTTRLLTPGGVVDYLDFYETAVFALGTVIAAAPELKNIANWYAGSMTNTLFKAYGMPGIKVEQYEPNWERIGKVFDQVEKVTPTDILIKKVMDNQILETLQREIIWRAQTPQVFSKSALQEALKMAEEENIQGTDEASLLERIGYQVGFVEGSSLNIKITTEEDWVFAEAIYNHLQHD
jgi:hypothetical protein